MPEAQETSDYPGALDTWVDVTNKEDLADQTDVNKIKAAIEAIQTEIGTDPAGTLATLKARLAIMMNTNGAMAQGTAFPTSPTPVKGQVFYRTDTNTPYQYDGSDWQIFSISRVQIFNASGDLVIPADTETALIFMCGAGGGGSGGHPSNPSSGGGGGAGESIIGHVLRVTGGSTYTVTVGVGGNGSDGDVSPANATSGGSTSVEGDDYTLTCAGGAYGAPGSVGNGDGGDGANGTIDDAVLTSFKTLLSPTDGSPTIKSRISFPGGDGANGGGFSGGGAGGNSLLGIGGAGGTSTPSHAVAGGIGAGGGGGRGGSESSNDGADGGDGIVIVIM
ncbi:MAG: hypothetical protein EOM12_16040 [Verrucomicrobiae bacterium]|nr:hypothetical protein [Verrucomicrobiae bacterium]